MRGWSLRAERWDHLDPPHRRGELAATGKPPTNRAIELGGRVHDEPLTDDGRPRNGRQDQPQTAREWARRETGDIVAAEPPRLGVARGEPTTTYTEPVHVTIRQARTVADIVTDLDIYSPILSYLWQDTTSL